MTTDVIIDKQGRLGRIRLNRPKAIHALNHAMCVAILDALAEFAGDDDIAAVVFDHAEGRGFCAGGDIRMLAESGQGDGSEARAFFHAEYRMNHALFTYAKPTIAIMDGITMGGGVGIALPCRYRVATENTRFAMPETGIGLFPDVGGGWYLSRLSGHVGMYLALTGARLDGAECLALGLATHYWDSSRPIDALDYLGESFDPDSNEFSLGEILDEFVDDPPIARIVEERTHIERLFGGESVAAIIAALDTDGTEWAAKQAATLRTKSPLSMAVAFRQLREGGAMPDFATEMAQEYAIGARMVHTHDFIEGVRALIVDKDNAPVWDPATPDGVSDAMLDAIFAPLPEGEGWTPH